MPASHGGPKFPREYPREFPREFPGDFPRDFPREFPREIPRDFPRDFPREIPREFPREFPSGYVFVMVGITKYCKLQWNLRFWNSSADPPDPAKTVAGAAVGTLPSTRRSLRMT